MLRQAEGSIQQKEAPHFHARLTSHLHRLRAGWIGGRYGVGNRISLRHTRAIVAAIHSGELVGAPTQAMPIFGLQVRARALLRSLPCLHCGSKTATLW
jgi:hypothetical protein